MAKKLIAYEVSDYYLPDRIRKLNLARGMSPPQPERNLPNGLPCIWAESVVEAVMQLQLGAMLNGVEPMTEAELYGEFRYATPNGLMYRALSSRQLTAIKKAMSEWTGGRA